VSYWDAVDAQKRSASKRFSILLAVAFVILGLLQTCVLAGQFRSLLAQLDWGWAGIAVFARFLNPVVCMLLAYQQFKLRDRVDG
jgi:hypothetical protein